MRRVHSASVGLARAQEDLHNGDEQRQRERTQAKVPRRVGAWARVRWAVDTETEHGRESDTRARAVLPKTSGPALVWRERGSAEIQREPERHCNKVSHLPLSSALLVPHPLSHFRRIHRTTHNAKRSYPTGTFGFLCQPSNRARQARRPNDDCLSDHTTTTQGPEQFLGPDLVGSSNVRESVEREHERDPPGWVDMIWCSMSQHIPPPRAHNNTATVGGVVGPLEHVT
jgi:hypothetical protein